MKKSVYLLVLLMVPTLGAAQSGAESCAEVVKGRPSKDKIRAFEECLRRQDARRQVRRDSQVLPGQVKRDSPTEVATREQHRETSIREISEELERLQAALKQLVEAAEEREPSPTGTSSEKRGEERVPPIPLVVPADDQEGSAEDSQELSREGDQSGSGEADQEKGDDDQEGSGEKNRVEPPPSPRVALNGQVELKEGEERLRQVQLFDEFASGRSWPFGFAGIGRGSAVTTAALDSNGIAAPVRRSGPGTRTQTNRENEEESDQDEENDREADQVEENEGGSEQAALGRMQLFQEFANGNWSIAFGGIDRGSHITAAGLDSNGIVKVTATEDQDVLPLVAFTPSLWVGNSEQDYDDGDYNDRFGVGPMIVANPGFVDPDSGSPWLLGVGVMLAVRTDSRGSSVGIGFAYALERLSMLRDDFRPNERAPLNAMGSPLEPVFENRTTSSWMFVVAFSIGNAGQS